MKQDYGSEAERAQEEVREIRAEGLLCHVACYREPKSSADEQSQTFQRHEHDLDSSKSKEGKPGPGTRLSLVQSLKPH